MKFTNATLAVASVLATLTLALLLWKLVRFEVTTAICPVQVSCPVGQTRGACSNALERANP